MISWFLLLVIFFIVVLGLAQIIKVIVYKKLLIKFDRTFFTIMMMIIFLIASFVIWFSVIKNTTEINIKYTTTKVTVKSIQNNEDIFLIGVGNTESNLYYYLMSGDTIKGYDLLKYDVLKSEVIKNENTNPYVIETYRHYDIAYSKNLLFGVIAKPFKNIVNQKDLEKTQIYIPKNSMQVNYRLK